MSIRETLKLPSSLEQGKKGKRFYLNLNGYRNAHHHTLNNAKVRFKEQVREMILSLGSAGYGRVKFTYRVFPRTWQPADISNICSVVDKFFSDAFVELGYLADDNFKYLPEVIYLFGGISKKNPRVEVTVEELTNMKVQLEQDEIDEALNEYLGKRLGLSKTKAQVVLEVVDDEVVATVSLKLAPLDQQETMYAGITQPASKVTTVNAARLLTDTTVEETDIPDDQPKPKIAQRLSRGRKPKAEVAPEATPEVAPDGDNGVVIENAAQDAQAGVVAKGESVVDVVIAEAAVEGDADRGDAGSDQAAAADATEDTDESSGEEVEEVTISLIDSPPAQPVKGETEKPVIQGGLTFGKKPAAAPEAAVETAAAPASMGSLFSKKKAPVEEAEVIGGTDEEVKPTPSLFSFKPKPT